MKPTVTLKIVKTACSGLFLSFLTMPLMAQQSSFSDIRALISESSGTLKIEQPLTVKGLVISDYGNPNLETNPNITFNTIDFDENEKTAYVQSEDGSLGFRLKFTDKAPSSLLRYSKVVLDLSGTTLVKEANPTRYTIKEVLSTNIQQVDNGVPTDLAQKSKTIAQLTDEDLYTFVSLADVEFALSDGSYSNVNDGYQIQTAWNPRGAVPTNGPRLDCYPARIRDKEGSSVAMLINAMVPWRRKGNGVPKGSGILNGILVHTKLLRYGVGEGEIGRYSIRPLAETDIAIAKEEESRFSETLVEWNWNSKTIKGSATEGLTPDIMNPANTNATISHTAGATATLTNDFNGLTNAESSKGGVPNSGICFPGIYWDFEKNQGDGFLIRFSTEGIQSSNLNLCFSIGSGSGSDKTCTAPVYWSVWYSTDGQQFTEIDQSVCVRPLVWWSNTALFCCAGNADYSILLPEKLFDQPQVTLKLVAKNTICATPTAAEGGTIKPDTAPVNVRLGAVSVKYNKTITNILSDLKVKPSSLLSYNRETREIICLQAESVISTVLTMSGQLVFRGENAAYTFAHPGIYLVQVSNRGVTEWVKLNVQ